MKLASMHMNVNAPKLLCAKVLQGTSRSCSLGRFLLYVVQEHVMYDASVCQRGHIYLVSGPRLGPQHACPGLWCLTHRASQHP